jgi:hypothetical protein
MFSIGLLFYMFYSFCVLILQPVLQNWGNYADMSQAVTVYVTFVSDVLLICWFGTQLTQHVRQNIFLFFLSTLLKHYFHNVYGVSNQLSNYVSFEQFSIFLPYPKFFTDFTLQKFETGFIITSRFLEC